MHDEYLAQLTTAIQDDPRILAGWLEGSLGRGNADRYSDIDLHLLLSDDGQTSFGAEAEQWLAALRPLVLFSLMFDGKMINALTVDGLRVDIWMHAAEVPTVDPPHAQVFYDPDQRIRSEHKEQTVDTSVLLPRIREFWRCISLTPAVVGRQELIVGIQGLGIETMLMADILMAGYGIARDRGVKNLNDFLPLDTRQEIEQALSLQGLSQESLVRGHLALARVMQTHGHIIATRHHFEYPAELERAVLDYVHKESELLGVAVEGGRSTMMQRSSHAMERASDYVRTSARPLEQARLAYLQGAPAEDVYTQLAQFQNEDGGFGHGLEPDLQSPTSTVLATTVALQILREVGAPAGHPLVSNAMRYLMAIYDAQVERWPLIDAAASEAPHAPWWTYDENLENAFGQFMANPRAEILVYLYDYPEHVPEDMRLRLTDAVLAHLEAAPDEMEMHDLLCYVRLVETRTLPEDVRAALLPKLRSVVDHIVARDPAAWEGYGLTPLAVVSSPHSPFAQQLADAIPANLDWLIAHQGVDGSWGPAWTWGDLYPDAWPAAEQDWKGVITVNTIRQLQSFGRLAT